MFAIRREQVEILEEAATKKFEDLMVVHLSGAFKEECQSLGETKVRGLIQLGIRRSRAYGIATERDVCKYVEVMFILGPDFDRDPRHAWARDTLTDSGIKYPADRIKAVREQAGDRR